MPRSKKILRGESLPKSQRLTCRGSQTEDLAPLPLVRKPPLQPWCPCSAAASSAAVAADWAFCGRCYRTPSQWEPRGPPPEVCSSVSSTMTLQSMTNHFSKTENTMFYFERGPYVLVPWPETATCRFLGRLFVSTLAMATFYPTAHCQRVVVLRLNP